MASRRAPVSRGWLLALLLALRAPTASARSAAARASASAGGAGGISIAIPYSPTTSIAPLPSALQDAKLAAYSTALATLGPFPLLCGAYGLLQDTAGNNSASLLGDAFFRMLPGAPSVDAVLAVRALRVPLGSVAHGP